MSTSDAHKRLKKAEDRLSFLAKIRMGRCPQTIRLGMDDQVSVAGDGSVLSKEQQDRLMTVYGDLLKDIHNNSRQSWTMGTIFMTASFVIFGLLLSEWKFLSNSSFLVIWGSAVVSSSLIWSWLSLSFFLADVGHKKYLVRDYIEIVLDLPRYVHIRPAGRGRYKLVALPLLIHVIWLILTFTFIPRPDFFRSWEFWFWIPFASSLIPLVLGIFKNYWVSVVEYDKGEKMKSKWKQNLQKVDPEARIVFLGWGSLITSLGNLRIKGVWKKDGPSLPIEFARISKGGRLTLVLCPGASDVKTQWAHSSYPDLPQSVEALREREDTKEKRIGFVSISEKSERCTAIPRVVQRIRSWADQKGINAVVWTDLPPNFKEEVGEDLSGPAAVRYLQSLEAEKKHKAEKYIRKAPKQTTTKIRKQIVRELGWEHR